MSKKRQKTPKLSVIMPVYNGERFLEESIRSVLNQTFKDFEFIIINDHSTDNSLKIIKSHKDRRIRLINNPKNRGSAISINTGFRAAKGKYLAISTQDDVSHPKRFEMEFDYLEKHPNIFLVGTSAIYMDENGKEVRRFRKYDNPKMLAWRLRKSCGIIFPSIMLHNKDLSFDGHHEYHLYYKLLKRGENLTNIPPFLVRYRVHSNAMSVFDKEEQARLRDEVIEKFKGLKDDIGFFRKIYYSMNLLVHHLRTINEKKIR